MKEGKIKSFDGTQLTTRTWLTDQPLKANVIFCHGLFEYAGRYDYEAEFFNKEGYSFYSFDQRTHGASDGKRRAFIKSFDNYVEDFGVFLNSTLEDKKQAHYIFAHSMGGLVTISFLLKEKYLDPSFKGILLSSPFLRSKDNMAPILQKMAGIIGTLFPTLRTVKARPNSISRDPEEVRKYIDDPLVYTEGIYAGTAFQMLKQAKMIETKLDRFNYPYLMMQGTDDQLAEIEGSKLLHSQSTSDDKEFVILENFKHEITRDIGRDGVLSKMTTWMDNRL